MVLDTCQRLEVYGIEEPEPVQHATVTRRWNTQDAFERLARIAAGKRPRPTMSPLRSVAMSVARQGSQAFKQRRARAS